MLASGIGKNRGKRIASHILPVIALFKQKKQSLTAVTDANMNVDTNHIQIPRTTQSQPYGVTNMVGSVANNRDMLAPITFPMSSITTMSRSDNSYGSKQQQPQTNLNDQMAMSTNLDRKRKRLQ